MGPAAMGSVGAIEYRDRCEAPTQAASGGPRGLLRRDLFPARRPRIGDSHESRHVGQMGRVSVRDTGSSPCC